MNKETRLIKRFVALFLVLLLSIESFGAVVSDNDGSAFITKAEFDSLKNNFQSQIDQYNTSIDSKIDGAIAAYLSGISIENSKEIEPIINDYNQINWVNGYFEKWKENVLNSSTTHTESAVAWRKPHFPERRTLRGAAFSFVVGVVSQNNFTAIIPYFREAVSNSKISSGQTYVDSKNLATNFIELRKDNNNQWSLCGTDDNFKIGWENHMSHYYAATNFIIGNKEHRDPTLYYDGRIEGDYKWYQNHNAGMFGATWLNNSDTRTYIAFDTDSTGTSYGKLRAKWVNLPNPWNSNILDDYFTTLNIEINSANSNLFAPEADWTPNQHAFGYFDGSDIWGFTPSTGMHASDFAALSDKKETYPADNNQQIRSNTIHKNFMLGIDDNNTLNVGYRIDTSDQVLGSAYRYDWTKSSLVRTQFNTLQGQIASDGRSKRWIDSELSTSGPWRGESIINSTQSGIYVDIPLWPRMSVNDLPNGKCYLDGVPLTVRQGLPIARDVDSSGRITLKIKYNVNNMDISDSSAVSQKVKLYVKNNDFKTNVGSDYYTTTDAGIYKNKSLNGLELETNDEVSLEIEVKKGDNIWLRLSPNNTSPSGLYANINQLRITFSTSS